MATVAQINANRANAQKSTGPRTAEGKALVAQNAVKHGLLAQREVIQGEDPGEFGLFRDRMRADLDPMGALEGLLADRVVNLAWRLRRAERLETAALSMLEEQHAARTTDKPAAGDDPDEREAVLARAVVEDFGYGKVLDRLLGYERRIENSLYRTMNELRKARLLREMGEVSEEVSSVKCEASSEQSQSPAAPSLPTEHFPLQTATEVACGVTTNGAQDEDELRQTKPMEVSSVKFEVSSEESREPDFSGPATSNVGVQTGDTLCETKPMEVSSFKCQVSGEEGRESSPSGPATSNFPLHTADTKCQVPSQPG